jgi:hypothetical protein
MLVDPRTTWSLVRTSPEELTIKPVPAAAPPVASFVLMLTMAGVTFAATAEALNVPVEEPPG